MTHFCTYLTTLSFALRKNEGSCISRFTLVLIVLSFGLPLLTALVICRFYDIKASNDTCIYSVSLRLAYLAYVENVEMKA